MIVVAGGMIRSGSTFAFNIVRELLLREGSVRTRSSPHVDPAELALPPNEHAVIKAHVPDPDLLALIAEGRVYCVCTTREPEDAVASWHGTFGFSVDDGIAMVKAWRSWHATARDRVLTIDFSTIESAPRAAAGRIADHLRLDVPASVLDDLVAKYDKVELKRRLDIMSPDPSTVDLGFSFYDRETFFHRRHINTLVPRTAADVLEPEQLAHVRAALAQT